MYLYTILQKTRKEQKRVLAEGIHNQGAHWSPGKAPVTRQVWGQAGKSVCGSGPIRSPVRQVILGTSPLMSLVIQLRCQKYDFLSVVNSTLSSPLSTSTFFRLCHLCDLPMVSTTVCWRKFVLPKQCISDRSCPFQSTRIAPPPK